VTEAEAYDKLSWPRNGNCLSGGLVLPVSGSERDDWQVFECTNCDLTGLSVPEAIGGCPCGGKQVPFRGRMQ
jgi:hypothetical protein